MAGAAECVRHRMMKYVFPTDIIVIILSMTSMKFQLSGSLSSLLSHRGSTALSYSISHIVSSVSRGWKRMIDDHRVLLNNLDFSDSSLPHTITTDQVTRIIARAHNRFHTIAIWNHRLSNWNYRAHLHGWSFHSILTSLEQQQQPSSLRHISLTGHQEFGLTNELERIIALKPITIDMMTCCCISQEDIDIIGSSPACHVAQTTINGNSISKKHKKEAESKDTIQLNLRLANNGTFKCSSRILCSDHDGDDDRDIALDVDGWYRQCPLCSATSCLACVEQSWQWSPSFNNTPLCLCSLCSQEEGEGEEEEEEEEHPTTLLLSPSPSSSSQLLHACIVHCQSCRIRPTD
jgi:hypothetical protein